MRVLRAMKADEDGLPKVGDDARSLGVRLSGRVRDVVADTSGLVHPETGGMSVSPPPPENLQSHRRPPEYGGTGRDPVWTFETEDLPGGLIYRPDPGRPEEHGLIEPDRVMSLEGYQRLLHETRGLWSRL
jgi:hypothetical protein